MTSTPIQNSQNMHSLQVLTISRSDSYKECIPYFLKTSSPIPINHLNEKEIGSKHLSKILDESLDTIESNSPSSSYSQTQSHEDPILFKLSNLEVELNQKDEFLEGHSNNSDNLDNSYHSINSIQPEYTLYLLSEDNLEFFSSEELNSLFNENFDSLLPDTLNLNSNRKIGELYVNNEQLNFGLCDSNPIYRSIVSNETNEYYNLIDFNKEKELKNKFESSLEKCSFEQLSILNENYSHIYINASPGTGKTFLIIMKALKIYFQQRKLHFDKRSRNEPIYFLFLTFSKKAANELENRLGEYSSSLALSANTFHKFFLKFLLKNKFEPFDKLDFNLISDEKYLISNSSNDIYNDNKFNIDENDIKIYQHRDYLNYLLQILRNHSSENDLKALIEILLNPNHVEDTIKKFKFSYIAMEWDRLKNNNNSTNKFNLKDLVEYQKLKNGITFSDILIFSLLYMKLYPQNIPKVDYLFVDEFQDTSSLQFELLSQLNPKNSISVGDKKQQIYTWRGASISNIKDYIKHFKAKEMEITNNFRSNESIVNLANKIIKSNMYTDIKNLKSTIFTTKYDINTSYSIAANLALEYSKQGKTTCILCRENAEVNNVKNLLNNSKNNANCKNLTVMTIHKSKGMEFDNIILIYSRNLNEETPEERRVFYVAVTRAKESLNIFLKSSMLNYFKQFSNDISENNLYNCSIKGRENKYNEYSPLNNPIQKNLFTSALKMLENSQTLLNDENDSQFAEDLTYRSQEIREIEKSEFSYSQRRSFDSDLSSLSQDSLNSPGNSFFKDENNQNILFEFQTNYNSLQKLNRKRKRLSSDFGR